jgi:DNA-binding MarR family transcriptional regulator
MRPTPPRPLADSTGFLLAWVAADSLRRYELALSTLGLSAHDAGVLSLVAAEPLKQARLSEHLGIFSAQTVRVVNRLEARGLVRRMPHAGDRRAINVEITPAGVNALAAVNAISASASAEILGALDADELQVFDALLRKLAGLDPK